MNKKQPNVFNYLDKQLDELNGMERTEITIIVPLKYKNEIMEWLANGHRKTPSGMGKGIILRCELH